MAHVFFSYSSQDRAFARQLAGDLEHFFDVWIDHDDIRGGLEWERAITEAISACDVFVVIVSPRSNESEWVVRETILAERQDRYRIPLLLAGELPLRLINLHYIDFQGEYEGGLQDLMRVLNERLVPKDRKAVEAQQFLGRGVLAYLQKAYSQADELVGQALLLQPEIAPTVAEFWRQMTGQASTSDLAARLMDRVRIAESSKVVGQYDEGKDLVEWDISIEAPVSVIDQIAYVQYTLHPTFGSPPQVVRARESRFRLTRRGWGIFRIPIEVHFVDGSVGKTAYRLTFTKIG